MTLLLAKQRLTQQAKEARDLKAKELEEVWRRELQEKEVHRVRGILQPGHLHQ